MESIGARQPESCAHRLRPGGALTRLPAATLLVECAPGRGRLRRHSTLRTACLRPSIPGAPARTSLAHTGAQSPHVDVRPFAAAIDSIPAAAGNTRGAPFGCVLLLPARVGCEIAMRPPGAAPACGYDTGFNSSRSVLKSRNSILSRHAQWSKVPGGVGLLAKARQARSYCVSVVVECRTRGRCAFT